MRLVVNVCRANGDPAAGDSAGGSSFLIRILKPSVSINASQRLGFSLDEIAELLCLDDGAHCEEASNLVFRAQQFRAALVQRL